jgi:glycosyltransferase involved in cell wall biosynthesis
MPNRLPNLGLVIPSLACGGAERVLVRLATGFLARGYPLTAITFFGREHDFYQLPDGVDRVALELAGPTEHVWDKLAGNLARVRALRSALRAAALHVVISFLTETNVLSMLAARRLGIPVIVTEHVDPRRQSLARPWRVLRRLVYPRAARLVSVSAGVDAAFGWLPAGQRRVIFNPVGPIDAQPDPAEPPCPALPFPWAHAVLGMGRLEAQKGFDLLIDAFARLAAQFPDWGLAILGEGSLRAKLQSQINSLGLSSRVMLPGTVPSAMAAMNEADLFVLSSRYEGFGLTLAEAMACSVAVIAADCPSGPAEIVRHGDDGLLVPAEDAASLARAMAELMSDAPRRRRLGAAARQSARRFDLNQVMPAWETLLEDVLQEQLSQRRKDAKRRRRQEE